MEQEPKIVKYPTVGTDRDPNRPEKKEKVKGKSVKEGKTNGGEVHK